MVPSLEALAKVDQKNRALALQAPEVPISSNDLFHETELSMLDKIVGNGILANELTYQTHNIAGLGESDLSSRFWCLNKFGEDKSDSPNPAILWVW